MSESPLKFYFQIPSVFPVQLEFSLCQFFFTNAVFTHGDFAFLLYAEDGVSSPEELWVFPGGVLIGQQSHDLTAPVV